MHNNYSLDLKQSLFSSKFKKLSPQKYSVFANEFLCDWLYSTYLREIEATIAYPNLLTQFKNNHHIVLNDSDLQDICKYFNRMIEDETEHAKLLETIIGQCFDKSINEADLQMVYTHTLNDLDHMELTNLLTKYYIGECHLWAGLYLIYKNCKDVKTAKIFHQLLIDETHHNNSIFKIYKKIKNNVKLDDHYFFNEVTEFRHFGLEYVKRIFKLEKENNKKTQNVIKLIYDHDWHQKFNLIFLKKTYKLYELFNPNCKFDQYCQIVNK